MMRRAPVLYRVKKGKNVYWKRRYPSINRRRVHPHSRHPLDQHPRIHPRAQVDEPDYQSKNFLSYYK